MPSGLSASPSQVQGPHLERTRASGSLPEAGSILSFRTAFWSSSLFLSAACYLSTQRIDFDELVEERILQMRICLPPLFKGPGHRVLLDLPRGRVCDEES